MAWVVGLANPAEIKQMQEAGYEVRTDIDVSNLAASEDNGDIGVAVYVDCDVQDLLEV